MSEWKQAIGGLIHEVELTQSHGQFQRVFLGGDLNFGNMSWDSNGEFLIHTDFGSQQEILFSLCTKLNLTNWVDKPTREGKILDVVLCNNWRKGLKRTGINIEISWMRETGMRRPII